MTTSRLNRSREDKHKCIKLLRKNKKKKKKKKKGYLRGSKTSLPLEKHPQPNVYRSRTYQHKNQRITQKIGDITLCNSRSSKHI